MTFNVGDRVIVKPRNEIIEIERETRTPIRFVPGMYVCCGHEYLVKQIYIGTDGIERANLGREKEDSLGWAWDTRWIDSAFKTKVEFTEDDLSELLNE